MNITKCTKCHRDLIVEEIELHECRKVVNYRIDGSILWLFDGKIWYPRKLIHQPKGNINHSNLRGNSTCLRVL